MLLEQIQSPEKINFRMVSPSDWEKFKQIKLESLRTDPHAFKGPLINPEESESSEYWTNLLLNSDKFFCAAEEDGAGFISIAGAEKIDEETWLIVSVYTSPDYRGQKLSEKLIQKVIDEVKIKGAKKVNLFVNTKQYKAVSLYERLGFDIVGHLDSETSTKMGDGNFYDKYFMEKKIG